jgi:hypothetical protein
MESRIEAIEYLCEALGGGLGAAVFELHKSHIEGGALDQSAHLKLIAFTFDLAALPVARVPADRSSSVRWMA